LTSHQGLSGWPIVAEAAGFFSELLVEQVGNPEVGGLKETGHSPLAIGKLDSQHARAGGT
jgi:hypothetical protein